MRRFLAAMLIGLGGLLLVLAIGLRVYVTPAVSKLPYDMQLCPPADQEQPEGCLKPSVAEATGATFLDKDGVEIRQGTLRSTTEVVPQAKTTADWQAAGPANRLGDNAIVWTVYGAARHVENNNALISAYSTELALDRATGAAVPWDGQWLDEDDLASVPRGNVKYEGQVYKFPFGTEQTEYQIYDRDLRKALPAQFVEVTEVEGVEAYHFKQTIDRQEVQNVSPTSLAALRGKFAPTATSVRVIYSNIREVWVDPVTGAYLNVREQQTKVLVPDVGTETVLLSADFKYTPQTVTNATTSAKNNQSQLKLVTLYGPLLLGLLGIVAIVVGFLMARRPRPAAAAAGAGGSWDETLPKPRHRLKGDDPAARDGPLTDTVPPSSPTWQGSPRP
jgi:hypothetical protein